MAKKTLLVCDVCGKGDATTLTVTTAAARPWRLDVCKEHLEPVLKLQAHSAPVASRNRAKFAVRETKPSTPGKSRRVRLDPVVED
jgi:hypothetical protein